MSHERLVLADNTDHARPAPRRDLHCGLPDLASHAEDNHRLVPFRHPGAAKTLDRRDKGHADPSRFRPRKVLRLRHHRIDLDGEMRGMSSVAADAEIAG